MNILYAVGKTSDYKNYKGDEKVFYVMPKYSGLPEGFTKDMKYVMHFYINIGWRSQYCGIFRKTEENVTFYFIDNELYFGDVAFFQESYGIERYTFFSRAVLEMLPKVGLKPDIINISGWESTLIPLMLKNYKSNPYYRGIETNIHTPEDIVV
ncbi:MAG: glycogen/starch synthase [Clostridia bacterium]|nr:glycogen/starch synthase [Clostridia bacterium]